MNKLIRLTIIALLTIMVAGAPLSLKAQKQKGINIQTTEFINASKEEVFDQIRILENYPKWSPFRVADPEQKYHLTGPSGEVGSTFHWEGVSEKSKGTQTITKIEGTDCVKMECDIVVPFKAQPVFVYTLTEKDGGVEVVQDFHLKMKFPANVFGFLFGVKKKMKATNKLGLQRLKELSEEGVVTTVSID